MSSDTFEKEFKNLNSEQKPSLLLHSCCAPCSSHVISSLMPFFNLNVFFYNPNIFPEEEYTKRKNEQIRIINILNSNENEIDFIDTDYDTREFCKKTLPYNNEKEGGKRCEICFYLRLSKTARLANEKRYDYFSTTLTLSPHKNADVINNIGMLCADENKCQFLQANFKKQDGYKKSIELSKKYNLYRQSYCGCESSLSRFD